MRLDPGIVDIPEPLTNAEMCRRARRKRGGDTKIAVLDLETDPFDNSDPGGVFPFLAVLYTGESEPLVLWDEDWKRLMAAVYQAILDLPGRYIVYAHNGGRFDYLFLLHELKGAVLFKGRSLMSANVGNHELRDSFHIIPEALKHANRKTSIDYALFKKGRRNAHRKEIIAYCIDDCASLYEIVARFKNEFGTPLTIGQAAMAELRKKYTIARLSPGTDKFFRNWFFGGRVECLKTGVYDPTRYYLYDVNSMYPYVMARYPHPIASEFTINDRIRANTFFLTIRCKNNGALVARAPDSSLTTQLTEGVFNTTIWEYETAMKHGLISDVEILRGVEFDKFSDFREFVDPLYDGRQRSKELQRQAEVQGDSATAKHHASNVLFRKLLMNNAYGKQAQNPERFKDHYITGPMERPDEGIEKWGELPAVETDGYWIWQCPSDNRHYNNVATAASITGAARSVLLDALASCTDPVYCDTDSIICRALDDAQDIDALKLGSWDIEAKLSAFIGNGKKLYAYRRDDGREVIKAKGMNGVTWQDMLTIAEGGTVTKRMTAPLIGKDLSQVYVERILRATSTGPSSVTV